MLAHIIDGVLLSVLSRVILVILYRLDQTLLVLFLKLGYHLVDCGTIH